MNDQIRCNSVTFRGDGRSVQKMLEFWLRENRSCSIDRSSASIENNDTVVMTLEYSKKE